MGIRDSLTEVTFKKRFERSEGLVSFENMLQVNGMASSKAMRGEHACLFKEQVERRARAERGAELWKMALIRELMRDNIM